ncbi:MAG: monofunctional biosynthetic peptidoglycan transglycosylase [candidate division KSB1 bacterium]|nr:monofunctional biosynthetic peptidoglycan transglycosylase [candidate division KSB1 bacterium]MDZ7274929.1 monofunctional biosynthetic peptidoglycan transglycosylase [candidate division KSB1 bacterium]MDZ7286619.1 monofunctional biosynthetic peptidoglycan transglycosylase [candidate division KSB1 bacterium]MDZ7299218.1 monofunctional biosynthetic peptidoglycan transglycosylase [candidate division KSB1 bacterium]MDZ7308351.1 monofunctional biosynthetic peptidoglycan transglycosylase [candidat
MSFSPLRKLSPRQRRFCFVALVLLLVLAGGWWWLFSGLPDEDRIRAYQPESTARIGQIKWEQRFHSPIRLWVPSARISSKLKQAVIVSEDDLFYRHQGFNLEMLRESFAKNLEKGRYVRGASTITMQLARNAFLHRQKTLRRKLREIIVTRRLEKTLSKERILELYLNVIEWGEGIYGAEAAARFYFGKPAAALDWAEASLLAGMLPNPKYFNPYRRPKACQRMQQRVLWLLQLHRLITPEQARALAAAGVSLVPGGGHRPAPARPAESDTVEALQMLRAADSLLLAAPSPAASAAAGEGAGVPVTPANPGADSLDAAAAPDSVHRQN